MESESSHLHTPSPPDEYGPRKGLEAAGILVCECGMERRASEVEWRVGRTFLGRQRALAWGNS